MSRSYFQKPEAVLQRAQDFMSVGKDKDALQALHDIIKADRRNRQWSQTYELIMQRYVELCVNLKNSSLAKDGLYQYKILTQQVAAKSLENVIEKYLALADSRTQEAQRHSIERIEEIDDLDVADAPERLILSVVSGAVAQDRMDRTVLSPWLRFLWDSYRNCLDLLRNNVLFEQLYHQIARQTFTFCLKYQRRSEFRKLCEILRLHLGQIQKSQANYAVKLTNIDSLTLMMETRLVQLDTAIAMELWQEAFKSAEDLHNIMQLTKDKDKKIVKPTTLVNYYDKIAMVFWKGNNTLFHAAALLQKFNIYKDMKKTFSDEEALDQATRVLLASLSIPDGADLPSILTKHLDIEELHHGNIRILSALLRLSILPTRGSLFREIARLNLPELADSNVYSLYKSIELEFNPLRIASIVEGFLNKILLMNRPDYSQYVENIKSAVSTKILKQLSKVYDSLTLTRLQEIIPFYKSLDMEQFLVDSSKHHSLRAQIDHRNQSIYFGQTDAILSGDLESDIALDQQKNEPMPKGIQSHLKLLFFKISGAVSYISKDEARKELVDQLKRQIKIYNDTKGHDHEYIHMRRKKIESYKENTETLRQEKILHEKKLQDRLEEQRKEEERKRIEQINKENEKRRKEAEKEELQRKVRMDKIKRIQTNPLVQQIIKERGEEIFESMDPDDVLKEHRVRMDAERKEQQQRLQQQEKKYDHSVRAFHFEEMTVRKDQMHKRLQDAPESFEVYETNRIEKARRDHENSFHTYARLNLAKSDALDFIQHLIETKKNEFQAEHNQWKINLEDAKEKASSQIRAEHEKKRKQQAEQKKMEEQRMAAEQAQQQRTVQIERRPTSEFAPKHSKIEKPTAPESDFSRSAMRVPQPQRDRENRPQEGFEGWQAGRQQDTRDGMQRRGRQLQADVDFSRAQMKPGIKNIQVGSSPLQELSSATTKQEKQSNSSEQKSSKYIPPSARKQ